MKKDEIIGAIIILAFSFTINYFFLKAILTGYY